MMQKYIDRLKNLPLSEEQKAFVLKACEHIEQLFLFPSKEARQAVYDEHVHDIKTNDEDPNGFESEAQADGVA